MNPLAHPQPAPEKPTPPGPATRLAWTMVAAAILGLLLVCAALVLVATWRGP